MHAPVGDYVRVRMRARAVCTHFPSVMFASACARQQVLGDTNITARNLAAELLPDGWVLSGRDKDFLAVGIADTATEPVPLHERKWSSGDHVPVAMGIHVPSFHAGMPVEPCTSPWQDADTQFMEEAQGAVAHMEVEEEWHQYLHVELPTLTLLFLWPLDMMLAI